MTQLDLFEQSLVNDGDTSNLKSFPHVSAILDGTEPSKTRVYINGQVINGLQKFAVSIDSKTNIPHVTMEFVPRVIALDIQGKSNILQTIPNKEA